MGVYTSQSQWTPIMGSNTAGSAYPIWYAHYISFFFLFPPFFVLSIFLSLFPSSFPLLLSRL